jgi:hypothetical protein
VVSNASMRRRKGEDDDDAKGRMTTKYARAMQAGKGETW